MFGTTGRAGVAAFLIFIALPLIITSSFKKLPWAMVL